MKFAEEIKKAINDFIETSPGNYCYYFKGRYFEVPQVGFARGDDPIFDVLKEKAGLNSMTPCEALNNSLRNNADRRQIRPEEVSVVSWVLPVSKQVRLKNRREKIPLPNGPIPGIMERCLTLILENTCYAG